MPISPSAALYLGADAVAPKDKKLSMGVEVPGRGVAVDLKSLSAILAAAALWSLRDAGAVHIAFEQKKGLLGTKTRVAVRPGQGGQPRSQAEAHLLHWLNEKDPFAKGVVARWLQQDSANPWGNVVGTFESELVQQGLLQPVQPEGFKGKLGAFASGRPKVAPVIPAIQAAWPEVDQTLQRWFAFNQHEGQLAQALVKECRDGIDSRQEQDDDFD